MEHLSQPKKFNPLPLVMTTGELSLQENIANMENEKLLLLKEELVLVD